MDVNFPIIPPVNNLIQPTIYDRLDAMTFEKIKVVNSQLNCRLRIQERVINKHRKDAERVHQKEYRTIRREIKHIYKRKPNYVDEFELNGSKHAESKDGGRTRSLSESSDTSFCRRYYSHHFDIKDPTNKAEKKEKKPVENDYFNARLRAFFFNMVTHTYDNETPSTLVHGSIQEEHETSTCHGYRPGRRRGSGDTMNTVTEDEFNKSPDLESTSELRFASRTSKRSDSVFTSDSKQQSKREHRNDLRRKRGARKHSRDVHIHGNNAISEKLSMEKLSMYDRYQKYKTGNLETQLSSFLKQFE